MRRFFKDGDFVRQVTDAGRVKLVVAVCSRQRGLPQMDRFTLMAINGAVIENIGSYELKMATVDEVRAALDAAA